MMRCALEELDEAIADLNEALKLDSKNASALVERARVWMEKGELNQAIADLSRAIKFEPGDADAYVLRGASFFDEEEYEKAIADFDEAINLGSESSDVFRLEGLAFYFLGDYLSALRGANLAVMLEPENAWALHCRALARIGSKEFAKAVVDLTKALKIEPGQPDLLATRSCALAWMSKWKRAFADAEAANAANTESAWPPSMLATLLAGTPEEKRRDGLRAKELAEIAIGIGAGKDSSAWAALAAACAELDDWTEAVRCQKKALKLSVPGDVEENRRLLEQYRKKRKLLLPLP